MNIEWTRKECLDLARRNHEKRFTLNASVPFAGSKNECDGGLEIEASVHYNGSGPQAFGGAKEWPHAKIDLSFPENDFAGRDAFIAAAQKFISDHFATLRAARVARPSLKRFQINA